MNPLDQVITVREAAELIGGVNRSNIRKVQRRCRNGTYTARQDIEGPKGTWLILRSSVKKPLE